MEAMRKLLALGAADIRPETLETFDLTTVLREAAEQGVWQLTFAGLKTALAEGLVVLSPADAEIYQMFQKQFMRSCILHTQKNEAVLNIVRILEAQGIVCCLLKGQSLAHLYANPECRVSSDIDLLVAPKDEQAALAVFRAHGFSVTLRGATSNHDKLEHPQMGVVELHISLYYDIEHDVWFDNLHMQQEPYVEQNGVHTLGVTDGFLYTLLHAVRHFVRSGLGLKQILDVLLYEKRFKTQMDGARITDALQHLKYTVFWDTLRGFGVEYMGFSVADFLPFAYEKEKVRALRSDVEAGGVFGKKEERRDCFDLYNACRFYTFKNGDFEQFMTRWYRNRSAGAFSFKTENMKKRYAYVDKHGYLLPIGWLHHAGVLFLAACKHMRNIRKNVRYKITAPSDEKMEERLKLYKYFDMI